MASSHNTPEINDRNRFTRPSESMWRSLIRNMADIIVVIDADGTIRFANPQMEKALGLRNENVIGRNIFDFIHPGDVPRTQKEYSQTIHTPGEGVPSLLRIRDAAGEWIPFEIIANNRLHDPDLQGVIFTARDLRFRREIEKTIQGANTDVEKRVEERTTELAKANTALRLENQARRQTEAQLQATVSLLNATLESTCDGILVISDDGIVTSHNRRFLEMWRVGSQSYVGQRDEALLAFAVEQMQARDEFVSKVQALYSDPTATSFDVLHLKDGRIFERYSQPQRIADRIVGRVWSFRDVTQAKRLEEELRQAQKMEAIGRLAGGISHDFNNLLMLIFGYVARLSDSSLTPEQKETCDQVRTVTKRAAALTGQLLTFSRKHQDSLTVTDLNRIVANVEGMLRSFSQCIRLDISLSRDPLPVLADISRVELMIMNLAINARDAMSDGGLLSITTRRQDHPPGGWAAKENSDAYAVLSVSDTGRGMTPEVRARIFEPFFTTKEPGKGTGLGLPIVYAIAERVGGHIEVQSEPNQGTRFDVYLPLTTPAAHTSPAAVSPPAPGRGTETILIAEDEAGIRAMTGAYLEGLGYRVLEAADGTDAVKVAGEYQGAIHLVLTDLLMPGMRGDSVVGAIRSYRPDVKALFISGYASDDLDTMGAAILHKPFEFPELGRRIRSLLDSDLAGSPLKAG